MPVEFYKKMIPDLLITLCAGCRTTALCGAVGVDVPHTVVFPQDDLELEVLKKKQCPFCRCAENDIGLP
jgi:hypothetical protein